MAKKKYLVITHSLSYFVEAEDVVPCSDGSILLVDGEISEETGRITNDVNKTHTIAVLHPGSSVILESSVIKPKNPIIETRGSGKSQFHN